MTAAAALGSETSTAAPRPPPSLPPPLRLRPRSSARGRSIDCLEKVCGLLTAAAAVAAAEGGLASRRLPTVPDRDRLRFRHPCPSVSLSAPPWLLPPPSLSSSHRTTTTTAVFSLSLLPSLPSFFRFRLLLHFPPSFGCFLPPFLHSCSITLHAALELEAWKFAERTGARAGE